MGQVPFGIVGDGRVARHMIHYFNLLRIPYRQWSRKIQAEQGAPPREVFSGFHTILVAIKDSAIEPWAKDYLETIDASARLVHFSGSVVTPYAVGMHPLMTFNTGFYDLADYQKIAFICEEGRAEFSSIFPGLKNPHYKIHPQDKAYYHALCVMSGNFSVILWRKLFEELERRFEIPPEAAYPYLERITKNLQLDSKGALTGPLQRKDQTTLHRNIESLEGDSFQKIYQAFVSAAGANS